MKFVAGIYLLLNLCVSTIPRCDSILNVLQHVLKSPEAGLSCHDSTSPADTRISSDRICECSLVKFVFVTLPNFDPQKFIGFQVQTTTLLSFDIPLWNPAAQKGPEPPYPRQVV